MSHWNNEYKAKLKTADEAVKPVKSGDFIQYTPFVTQPRDLDAALARRKEELSKVYVRVTTLTHIPEIYKVDPQGETFLIEDGSFSAVTRKMKQGGEVYYAPGPYHEIPITFTKGFVHCDYLFAMVTPMDKDGFFNMSTSCSTHMSIIRARNTTQTNLKIIVEVNKNIPTVQGENNIHISEVDAIVENRENLPLNTLPVLTGDELDDKIANHIMNEMVDGACLQLGIGGMPNLVGKKIAESDLKDLGCHSEMFCDAYMDLFNAGKLTNRSKNTNIGKSVFTFAMGSQPLYDFMDNNPSLMCMPVAYTNDPCVIAQNDKVYSICSCINVDLFANVSSESAGYRQISGIGGQFDYHFASLRSNGGKGFVCLHSARRDKEGNLKSNIVISFEEGTQITVPGSITNYVVTEYGAVNLKGLTTWERAEALVNLAHPEFREELIKTAEKGRIWRASNKRV